MTRFIDTHAHLGDSRFDLDRDAVFARAAAAGVDRIVEIADAPEEWPRALALATARPESMRCALGLHPYHADQYDDAFLAKLRAAIDASPVTAAIGEIGLDYAKSTIAPDVQRRAFSAIAAAARDWDLPLVVHCRDAYQDMIPILKELFPRRHPTVRFWGVIHCFTGTPEDAIACKEIGFALGADGPVTYKKNDALREAFKLTGPEVAVLETDCPYLPPQSCRGQRNEPGLIPEIALRLAEVWGISLKDVAHTTSANALDLYRW